MFSEDPPYFRYAAIFSPCCLIGFGLYQQFFRAAEEIPEEFTLYATSYTSANGNIRLDWQPRILVPQVGTRYWGWYQPDGLGKRANA